MLLTALEFHQELLENDGESPDILVEKFSFQRDDGDEMEITRSKSHGDMRVGASGLLNVPGKGNGIAAGGMDELARKPSISVLEKELSDKNKKMEQTVALLRHELRLAQEEISSLKNDVSVVDNAIESTDLTASQTKDVDTLLEEQALSPFERKVLNYLIYEYIVSQGLKLTAITFSEEVIGNVKDWEDLLGSRLASRHDPPPPLLAFYRYFYNVGPNKELDTYRKKLEASEAQLLREKESVSEERARNVKLSEKLQRVDEEMLLLRKEHKRLRKAQKQQLAQEGEDKKNGGQGAEVAKKAEEEVEVAAAVTKDGEEEERLSGDDSSRGRIRIYHDIKTELDMSSNDRVAHEISSIVELDQDPTGMVKVVANCIPHVVKGVILSKREELLPILLVAIRQHPDPAVRDVLTRLMFNVILKPSAEQRSMIMSGCVTLASVAGSIRTEMELLPQCWEQMTDKYEERRVLVADSCGALGAFIRPELRSSLILSILEQLLDDKSKLVREAVARNLAHVVTFLSEKNSDKLQQTFEMMTRLLKDSEMSVLRVAEYLLLPTVLDWADASEKMCKVFLSGLLSNIATTATYAVATGLSRVEYEHRIRQLQTLVDSFASSLSRLRETVLITAPFGPQYFKANMRGRVRKLPDIPPPGTQFSAKWADPPVETILIPIQSEPLQKAFDEYCETNNVLKADLSGWPALQWIVKEMLPRIMEILGSSDHDFDSTQIVVSRFAFILSRLCVNFGQPFTRAVVQKIFTAELSRQNVLGSNKDLQDRRERILPAYVVGVLPTLEHEELSKYIKGVIINVALQENGWSHSILPCVKSSLLLLCKKRFLNEKILDLLWDLVVHPATQVRAAVLTLFDAMMDVSDTDLIKKRVLPALITLSTDVDRNVRLSVVKPLGTLAMNTHDPQVNEKIGNQFEMILSENATFHVLLLEVVQNFKRVIPHVSSSFRDNSILPSLLKLAKNNNSNRTNKNRAEMAEALFDAYRAFDGCLITPEAIQNYILPGLKFVGNDAEYVGPRYKRALQTMLKDMEKVVTPEPPVTVAGGAAAGGQAGGTAGAGKGPAGEGAAGGQQQQAQVVSMGWMDILRQTIGGENDGKPQ